MARLGNVFNNKEDIKKEEQHPRRTIKWIHYILGISHLRRCYFPRQHRSWLQKHRWALHNKKSPIDCCVITEYLKSPMKVLRLSEYKRKGK